MAMRGHAERIGLQSPPKRIMATGGASANHSLLRIMANVFGCPVFTGQSTSEYTLLYADCRGRLNTAQS